MNKRVAIVIGATGLIGSVLVEKLLASEAYTRVIVFSRRPLAKKYQHKKLAQHQVDFDDSSAWQELVVGDDLYCCLGTTIKRAGSKVNQKRVDLDYPIAFAQAAYDNGVGQVIVVSSIGANPNSRSFYLSLKGRLEQALVQLDFQRTIIVRPSVLVGQRQEFRLGEVIASHLLSWFAFLPVVNRYRPVRAETVAKHMLAFALNHGQEKVLKVESNHLIE